MKSRCWSRAAAGALVLCAALAAAQSAPQRFVVVLDAAHGGSDVGAKLGNQAEKNYTLALNVKLRSQLGARGITVVTTREADSVVEPDRRAEIANHAGAAACLSLHAATTGSGVHLFVSSQAAVVVDRLAPWKTAQAAWTQRSLALAGVLNSALTNAGIAVTLGRTALPGVDSMSCPAVAVEVAPEHARIAQSGAKGAANFDDAGYQMRVVKALAAALVEWREEAKNKEARQP